MGFAFWKRKGAAEPAKDAQQAASDKARAAAVEKAKQAAIAKAKQAAAEREKVAAAQKEQQAAAEKAKAAAVEKAKQAAIAKAKQAAAERDQQAAAEKAKQTAVAKAKAAAEREQALVKDEKPAGKKGFLGLFRKKELKPDADKEADKQESEKPAGKVPEKPEAEQKGAKPAEEPKQASEETKPSAEETKANKGAKGAAKLIEKERQKRDEEMAKKGRKLLKQRKRQQQRVKRDAQYKRRMLGSLLVKAGYATKPEQVQRSVFYVSFVVIVLATVATLLIAAVSGKQAGALLLFYLGLWTAVFAFVYLIVWMVIYVFLDLRIYRRVRELEDVLPDFLQLASANISAGMPVDRALWFAVRPNFGVLAKEIEEVAKATLAGEELAQSLLHFTEKYDSVTLRRSVNILLEGMAAGGEMADLLNKIAIDIQETKILRKEMSANVATYAIFITFASIVMAPVLFALATQLLTIIVKITSTIDLSNVSSNFLTLNVKTSPAMITNFRWFSIMMLSFSALMSGAIVSVIRKGRVKEGIRNLPIFLAVSILLYFLVSSLLHGMLGSLV